MAMGRRREGGGEESSEGRLLEMCIRAACRDMKSVRAWRQKRRTLEMLPSELAERLFHRLLQAHLLSPPLIELVLTTSSDLLASLYCFFQQSRNRLCICVPLFLNVIHQLLSVVQIIPAYYSRGRFKWCGECGWRMDGLYWRVSSFASSSCD